MSVFYNLKANANSGLDREARFLNTGTKGAVIPKQNEYLVGVRRFKIPIADVPLWRFYNQKQVLGLSLTGGFKKIGKSIGHTVSVCERFNAQIRKKIDNNNKTYGYDDRFNDANGDQFDFIQCGSQKEIINNLNQTLASSIASLGNTTLYDIGTFPTLYGDQVCGAGDKGITDGTTCLISFQIPSNVAQSNFQDEAYILSSLSIQLGKFTIGGTDADLSKFNFYIEKHPIGTTPKTTILTGAGANPYIDDKTGVSLVGGQIAPEDGKPIQRWTMMSKCMEGLKSTTDRVGDNIVVGSSDGTASNSRFNFYLDIQDCDSGFYDGDIDANGLVPAFKGTTTATDLPSILGNRVDGFNYFLICENLTYQDKVKIPNSGDALVPVDITFSTSDIGPPTKTHITHNKLSIGFISAVVNTKKYIYPANQDETNFLMPYFKYNDETQKVCLQVSQFWNEVMGFELYMNKALSQMIGFNDYRKDEVNARNYTKFITVQGGDYTEDKYNGYTYRFPIDLGRREITEVNTGRTIFSVVEYYERASQVFARDFLNSIKVFTSSIAVIGESVGDGDNVERVLTDFVLDPSVVGRDYIVYTPQGGVRYYELDAPTALRRVDASIFYEDIYGNTRPLFIPAGMECSLKLEFRPKNMVYNFINL